MTVIKIRQTDKSAVKSGCIYQRLVSELKAFSFCVHFNQVGQSCPCMTELLPSACRILKLKFTHI